MSSSAKRRPPVADPRIAAALALADVLQGRSLSASLPRHSRDLVGRDRGLAAEVAYGSCRWYWRLEAIGRRLLKRPLKRRDLDIQALLICGLYQLEYTRVPPHAAVAETAGAARQLRKPWATALLNAALRRFERETQQLTAGLDDKPTTRYALPAWLLEHLQASWPDHWQTAAEALQEHPPMSLRVNLSRVSLPDYQAQLGELGVAAWPVRGVPGALVLDKALDVAQLPGFDQGLVSVQDANAQRAAWLLDVRSGHKVLDACAAPGGKTCHLLEIEPQLELTAVDIDAERLTRVRENLDRLCWSASLEVGDASAPKGAWTRQQYDRILLDVPCTATGAMRRNPDIRILRRADDVAGLAQRQAQIMDAIWPMLKPGGKLLYVTCSILAAENQQRIESFMQQRKDVTVLPVGDTPGDGAMADAWGHACSHGRQLLPGDQGGDGFYYALLQRQAGV